MALVVWAHVLGTAMVCLAFLAPLVHAGETPEPTGLTTFIPWVRYDPRPPILWGNLTWADGKGRIVWGPAEPAEGGGGTPNPVAEQSWNSAGSYEHQTGRPLMPYPEPDVFESDPLPVDAWINVSRSFLVQVQIKVGSPDDVCHAPEPGGRPSLPGMGPYYTRMAQTGSLQLDLEIEANGRRIAGTTGDNIIDWRLAQPTTRTRPTDVTGHSACHFAASSETAFLAKGTILKVRLIHIDQSSYFTYGFGEGRPSTIRIPLYPTEEILFRYPAPAEADDDPLADYSIAGVGLPLLLLAPLGRRGRTAAIALLLLSTAALAGCLNRGSDAEGPDDGDGGTASQTRVRDPGGDLTTNGGSIIGQVTDDLRIPIGSVHVSVLGRSHFTQTDGLGRFRFVGLAPGEYQLRFNREGYHSFETNFQVEAGFVTKAYVTLYLVNPKARDFRPHVHDYWTGLGPTKLALDVDLPVTCSGTPIACPWMGEFRLSPRDQDNNSVLPGTYQVNVTLTFSEAELGVARMGLAVLTNLKGNESYYAPRASGVPFHISTSWEMTDPGHVPFSYWTFYWIVPRDERPAQLERYQRSLGPPPAPKVHAKVELVRGPALPLEPAHPNEWGDKNELVVLGNRPVPFPTSTLPPGSPGWTGEEAKTNVLQSYARKIPPGTALVEVTVTQSRESHYPFGWRLYYKPGHVPPDRASTRDWTGYHLATFQGKNNLDWKWLIVVKPHETDSVYTPAQTTGWTMWLEVDDADNWWLDHYHEYGTRFVRPYAPSLGQDEIRLTATVKAHRSA